MNAAMISPNDLNQRVLAGQTVDLIDVRTPAEFQETHVPFARNIPLDRLSPSTVAREAIATSEPIYVICRSGSRGRQAQEKLIAVGCSNVVNVEGRTLAWDKAGLPVIRG